MSRRWRGWAAVACVAVTVGLACKPKQRSLSICPEMVAAGKAMESETRDLPLDVWFAVLIRGFNRTAMDPGDEPRECSGKPIEVEWPISMAGDPRAKARKVTRYARTADDITFAILNDDEMLIWARTDTLENGDALGPVALTRWVPRGVEVLGIGTIQAPYARVRMRLEPLGTDAKVLVIESETCTEEEVDGEPQDRCEREAQVVPLSEQRFVGAHLIENGDDTGPARFRLAESRELELPDGWVRRFDLQRRLEFDGNRILVHESIRARDCNPKSPDTPCEEQITIVEKRNLDFKDGALHTTRGAWDKTGKPPT